MNTVVKDRARTLLTNDRGTAFIELALVMTVYLLLLLGAFEFGRLAYISVEVANAAHAGVQYGAQTQATAANSAGMQAAAISDAPDVAGMTATATNYCKCSNGTSVSCTGTCTGSHMIQYVQVNTSVTVAPIFTYPTGLPPSLTLTGAAVMRVEQ